MLISFHFICLLFDPIRSMAVTRLRLCIYVRVFNGGAGVPACFVDLRWCDRAGPPRCVCLCFSFCACESASVRDRVSRAGLGVHSLTFVFFSISFVLCSVFLIHTYIPVHVIGLVQMTIYRMTIYFSSSQYKNNNNSAELHVWTRTYSGPSRNGKFLRAPEVWSEQ